MSSAKCQMQIKGDVQDRILSTVFHMASKAKGEKTDLNLLKRGTLDRITLPGQILPQTFGSLPPGSKCPLAHPVQGCSPACKWIPGSLYPAAQ